MRILHILAGAWPGSGIAEVVAALSCELKAQGHEVTVATLEGPLASSLVKLHASGGCVVRFSPCHPSVLFYSSEMRRGLATLVQGVDVVHVHGCWTFPVWWGCHLALKHGKALVRSPHGCFDPVRLRHSAWKKRLVGWLDRYFLRRSAVIHVTAEREKGWVEEFLKCGNSNVRERLVGNEEPKNRALETLRNEPQAKPRAQQRIVVIPNGVNIEEFSLNGVRVKSDSEDTTTNGAIQVNGKRTRTVLYLGRLHPLKGLDLLISAWAVLRSSDALKCESDEGGESGAPITDVTVSDTAPAHGKELTSEERFRTLSWRLVIAGPDEQGTLQGLMRQVRYLRLEQSVTFCGALHGAEKVKAMATADLFVLPTRSENFGIVIAEALACGVPVITTTGAPWQEIQTNACGWWIDIGETPLVDALRDAMRLTDDERRILGINGQRLVASKYRWPKIAAEMERVYQDIYRRDL